MSLSGARWYVVFQGHASFLMNFIRKVLEGNCWITFGSSRLFAAVYDAMV